MRHWIQVGWTALTNGYLLGLVQGKLYQGQGKQLCVPGLHCYSCPSSLGACPVGAFQASLTTAQKSIPYYAIAFLLFFGALMGRGVCGFLCPFGMVQDFLHKIPSKKIKLPRFLDKLRLNDLVFLVFVLGMPLLITNDFGMSSPAFCKWICPAGTLFGGIPLLATNESLRASVGLLFSWKFGLLLVILGLSVLSYRPFCRYLCPLGAIYGKFNSFSLYRLELDKESCIGCGACERACPMDIPLLSQLNSARCVRCGDCVKVCPNGSLRMTSPKRNTGCNKSCSQCKE